MQYRAIKAIDLLKYMCEDNVVNFCGKSRKLKSVLIQKIAQLKNDPEISDHFEFNELIPIIKKKYGIF